MSGRPEVKYAFIRVHRGEFMITLMCEVLKVSRSGYYDWYRRDHSGKESKLLKLKITIEQIFQGSRNSYGSPRIYQALKGLGIKISEDKVGKIMAEMGLRPKAYQRFKVNTTDSKHRFPIAENLLDQCFEASAPGEIMLGDITYIPTDEGWLYLAGVLDLNTRA